MVYLRRPIDGCQVLSRDARGALLLAGRRKSRRKSKTRKTSKNKKEKKDGSGQRRTARPLDGSA
jgi:hypothetical protein